MFVSVLIFGIFGAVIGSFLNVFVLRHSVKSLTGRSACASCSHEIEALDLVPIVSWLALRGRCRFCGSKISAQYPLVEAITAISFGFVGGAPIPLALQCLALPIMALLIAISVYDLKHGIIPDAWALVLSLFSLVFSLEYLTTLHELSSGFILLFLAAPACALPFAALWYVSGGAWMGFGDAKLAWSIGWLLGPLYALLALVLSFVIGALVSVCILLPLSSRRVQRVLRGITPTSLSRMLSFGFTMRSEVAFGPFLAVGCALIWLMILYGLDPLAYLNAVLP